MKLNEIKNMYKTQYIDTAFFLVTKNCSLSCKYCVPAGTKILDGNFNNVNIENIEIGNKIIGFDEFNEKGKQRKTKTAEVLRIFNRVAKDVIQLNLENGMSLQVTKEHPILTSRGGRWGWRPAKRYKVGQNIKYFPNIEVIKPNHNQNYRVGYIVGMMVGDGCIKKYIDKNGYDMFKIRLAVKDDEIIDRMEKYLNDFEISLYRKPFLISTYQGDVYKDALFGNKRKIFNSLNSLIQSNYGKNNAYEYYCGFLAGIYDAEGNISKKNKIIRISNYDNGVLNEIERCLNNIKIPYKREEKGIRILSPRAKLNNLKFIKTISPAVKRKSIENFYYRPFTSSKVKEVKFIGEKKVYNLETTSNTYFANNFAVHNCYELGKHINEKMSDKVVEGSIDFLYRNAIKAGKNNIHVTFFGGEPTTAPDVIKKIIHYGITMGKKMGLGMRCNMITNTVHLSDGLYKILENHMEEIDLGVQMSVDGIEEVQNMYRVMPDGSGSFSKVEKTVQKYKKLFKNRPKMLTIHGCLNKKSLKYLYENYNFFRKSWGLEKIWFLPVMEEMWDDEDVKMYKEQNQMIYEDVINRLSVENNIDVLKGYSPFDRCLSRKGKAGDRKPCGAGNNFCTIDTEGNLYPCHQIYYHDVDKESCFGNVWKGPDDDKRRLFMEYDGYDLSCPDECTHNGCYRCLAVNWGVRGSILSQKRDKYCKMMKVDEYFQDKLRKIADEKGFNNNNDSGCLCQNRG